MRQFADYNLPDGTRWSNQFNWAPVRQKMNRTTSGNVVYTVQKLHKGQPILLEFPEDGAWLSYVEMKQFVDWAALPGLIFIFTWDNFQSPVLFDHSQNPVLQFEALVDYDDPTIDQFYGRIQLITV